MTSDFGVGDYKAFDVLEISWFMRMRKTLLNPALFTSHILRFIFTVSPALPRAWDTLYYLYAQLAKTSLALAQISLLSGEITP